MKKLNLSLALLAVSGLLMFSQPGAEEKEQAVKADPVQVIMENYLAIGNKLSQDSFKGVDKNAQSIVEATSQILKEEKQSSAQKKEFLADIKEIQKVAKKFVSKDLKTARESYKSLSQAVTAYVKSYGYPSSVFSFYCPMVEQSWFQSSEQIANPFYGSQMLRCGEMTGMVKEGKYVEKENSKKSTHKH